MEKHILSWDSGGKDKTAITIIKQKSQGNTYIGEVIFSGIGAGAVVVEDLITIPEYEAIKAELNELLCKEKQRKNRTAAKVERALGITLYDWQKEFIFEGKPYAAVIGNSRCNGKTLAHCLRLCLSDGKPITASLNPPVWAKNDFLHYLGEDAATPTRARFFIDELHKVYTKLRSAGGIDLREIEFEVRLWRI